MTRQQNTVACQPRTRVYVRTGSCIELSVSVRRFLLGPSRGLKFTSNRTWSLPLKVQKQSRDL